MEKTFEITETEFKQIWEWKVTTSSPCLYPCSVGSILLLQFLKAETLSWKSCLNSERSIVATNPGNQLVCQGFTISNSKQCLPQRGAMRELKELFLSLDDCNQLISTLFDLPEKKIICHNSTVIWSLGGSLDLSRLQDCLLKMLPHWPQFGNASYINVFHNTTLLFTSAIRLISDIKKD